MWDGPEEARRVGEEIEAHVRRGGIARRHRDPRPRPVPDPRVRGTVHRDRPRLPDRRRLPLLRARRNPRRARLPPPGRPAGRRPRLRPDRQRPQARPRRQGRRQDPPLRPRHQQPLLLAAAQMLDSDELTPQARRSLARFVGDIARWRTMAAKLPHAELARILLDEERLHRRALRPSAAPKPPAASRTSPS